MPYELFIGLRYLKAKRKQAFISLITVISTAGIALGVMALIVVLAVMSGFENDLMRKILGTNAHVWVLSGGGGDLRNPQEVIRIARETEGVVAAAPFTFHQVMLSFEGRAVGTVLRGVDLASSAEVTDLPRTITEVDPAAVPPVVGGRGESFDPSGIILGRSLAATLGARIGSTLTVISPLGGMVTPLGLAPRVRPFQVVGFFEVGMYEYDSALAYIPLPTAQRFFGMGEAVTGVEVKVADIYQAGRIAREIRQRGGYPIYTRDWMQTHRNLFSAIRLEKIAMFVILTMIVLVAAFNIVSTLTLMVMDKGSEIGILKAMGATSQSVMAIFMVGGVVIGLVGTVAGTVGGYLICWLQATYKIVKLRGDVYFLDTLPILLKTSDMVVIALAALLLSFLATLYPSWRAAQVDPVVAIRYE